jgi:hypothetical protein
VDEKSVGWLLSGGTGGWVVDNDDETKPGDVQATGDKQPWYTKDTAIGKPTDTVNGCVISSEMRDNPGLPRYLNHYRAYSQDFESCAICMRANNSCNGGAPCVLGCVQWGIAYSSDPPMFNLKPARYPLPPSSDMNLLLRAPNKTGPVVCSSKSLHSRG